MTKSFIKKIVVAATLSLVLSLQLTTPVFAATDEEILAASQAGVDYLSTNQNTEGAVVGFSDVTDWAVIAVAADGQDQTDFSNGGATGVDYLLANPLDTTAAATDVEKRILAIAATSKDTTDFGGVDYDSLLESYHNNQQIGDTTLLNDDIFGIMAAGAAADPNLQVMAQDALDYLIAHQGTDGGFSYSTASCAWCGSDSNDTAAAIVAFQTAAAMSLANDDLADAVTQATAYLLSTQQIDGGFSYDIYSPSDGSSTAWALIALNSLGSGVETEASAARDWLLANQNTDGGFSYGAYGFTDSDVYTTAHAIIALMGTTWLMQPEPLQASDEDQGPTSPPIPSPETPPAVQPMQHTATPVVTRTSSGVEQQEPEPVVLASETVQPAESVPTTTAKDAASTKKADPKKHNYALFVSLSLFGVAAAWFVIQSNSKKTKK